MTEAEQQRFVEEVRQRRGGVVAFDSARSISTVDFAVLNQFAVRWGLEDIGAAWREITREMARTLLRGLLLHDLAYGVEQMPDAGAWDLANQFVGIFTSEAQFFTNTDYGSDTMRYGWIPLTTATFDAGVLGIDENTIGILVVQDED